MRGNERFNGTLGLPLQQQKCFLCSSLVFYADLRPWLSFFTAGFHLPDGNLCFRLIKEKKRFCTVLNVLDVKLTLNSGGLEKSQESSTCWDVSNVACQMMTIFGAASFVVVYMRTWRQEPIPQLNVQPDPLIFLLKTIKAGTFWKSRKTTEKRMK